MGLFVTVPNPFQPHEREVHEFSDALTIRQYLHRVYGADFVEFDRPMICAINQTPVMRAEWDTRIIRPNEIVIFTTVTGDPGTIIGIIIAIISIAMSLMTPPPETPGEQPTSQPVFSTKGQRNGNRLNEPIEVCYGKNRIFPSIASFAYFRYVDNEQFQYALFCLGNGEFDLANAVEQIGDTDVSNFAEVETELIPPGGNVNLFPTNVRTSSDPANQEILAPNDDSYSAPGWVGPFVTNEANTDARQVEFDVVAPRGLYLAGQEDQLHTKSVKLQVQLREIDDAGNPVTGAAFVNVASGKETVVYTSTEVSKTIEGDSFTAWIWQVTSVTREATATSDPAAGTTTTVYSDAGDDDPTDRAGVTKTVTTIFSDVGDDTITISGRTTTPIRRTFFVIVEPGRYEMQMRRTDNLDERARAGHRLNWEGLRALIDEETNFGAVTLWAVKIRATNNLNSENQQRFNIIAERKLPIRDEGTGAFVLAATRKPVWAFVDAFRAQYGGRQGDDVFDWTFLHALDATLTARGDTFDWIFRDPITVWDAAKAIMRAVRTVPLQKGSLITGSRDSSDTTVTAFFSQENIIEGTFQWSFKLWGNNEVDSLRVEYTEPDSGYLPEVIEITDPVGSGGSTDNIKEMRLPGIADRTMAYREGLYTLRQMIRIRENMKFDTGREGLIISFGDVVGVAHHVTTPTKTGFILKAETGGSGSATLWLNRELTFETGNTYEIYIQDKDGDSIGPLVARETNDPAQIEVEESSGIDFRTLGTNEPMPFVFGESGESVRKMRVVNIQPSGAEAVTLTCSNIKTTIFDGDTLDPPALDPNSTPPEPSDVPTIDSVTAQQIAGSPHRVSVFWPAEAGATFYVYQFSYDDGTSWSEEKTTTQTGIVELVSVGTLKVRVAGVGVGRGNFTATSVTISAVSEVTEFVAFEDSVSTTIKFWEAVGAISYKVDVLDSSQTGSPSLVVDDVSKTALEYDWTAQDAADHGLSRDLTFSIDAVVEDPDDATATTTTGFPATINVTNSVPGTPTGVTVTQLTTVGTGDTDVTYEIEWTNPADNDLTGYKIWISTNPFFSVDDTGENPPDVDVEPTGGMTASATETHNVVIPLDSSQEHVEMYVRVGVFDPWGDETLGNISGSATIPAET